MSPQSILIVGSGIAGPALATFLLLAPLPAAELPHITILERASSPRPHGQNIDVRGAGITLIKHLGLERTIRASLTNETGVQLVDSQNRVWAQSAADKTGKVQTGTSDVEILRGRLAGILLDGCRRVSKDVEARGGKGVEIVFGDYVESMQEDGDAMSVTFAESRMQRRFDVVVGADGLQSQTRRMAWGADGEDDRVKKLGMYAGFFSMPRGPTDSLWRRWYRAPGGRSIMQRPSDQPDRSTVFISVINENDTRLQEVARLGAKGSAEQKALLTEYFEDAGWESKRIVKEMNAADDFYYDMVAQVKMEKWSKGRVVLLGDAGYAFPSLPTTLSALTLPSYCASPISGMGTTLGLVGAYNLAGALIQHPDDLSTAFAQYEKHMRPTVVKAQKLAPGAPRIFNPQSGWVIWLCNVTFWLILSSGVSTLLFRFAGPPANAVPVEDYGFRRLDEEETEK